MLGFCPYPSRMNRCLRFLDIVVGSLSKKKAALLWLSKKIPLLRVAVCFVFSVCIVQFAYASGAAARGIEGEKKQEELPVEIYLEKAEAGNSQFYIPESVNRLVTALGTRPWEVLSFSRSELEKAIKRNPPDFVFTNSDMASVLERYLHYDHLLSFKNNVSSNAGKLSGSLIVVNKDSDIRKLDMLVGKRIGRLSSSSMAGWKTAVGEVTALGYSPQYFFKRIQSFDNDIEMIRALTKGELSAAILQGCHYERLPGKLQEVVRPLEPRTFSETQCLSTSELYPAWSLMAAPGVPKELNRKVIETLKNDRSLSTFGEWTDPASLRDVYALLKRSHDDLIDSFEPESWTDVIWKARYPALIVLLLLLALFVHDRLVVREVEKQTSLVKESLKKQWEMERKVEAWERASIVSIMSSMVAHELKQPLTVIENYAQSLLSRQKHGSAPIPQETLIFVMQKIEGSVSKAIDIIEHVQSFSKNRPLKRVPTNVSALLNKVVGDFQLKHPKVKLIKAISPDLEINGDEFELSICFLNILKNSLQAMESQSTPEIKISAEKDSEGVVKVTFTDNGHGLTQEQIKNLRHPLQTSKKDGLGLGLSIVRAIAERHRGSVRIEAAELCGLSIVVQLGRSVEKSQEKG
ncbi:sensor histidine kinase [Turicimonas muris]|uniref:sensor histidine kinase n=1 Tax=Turicimonas muris TaxID=1796652 RepID=UPI002675C7A9|nr:sensor histidine kinase [Turicimonas muris]